MELSDCIKSFLEPEVLSEDDTWYCSICREHVQAEKKINLWKMPKILIVHLKRFAFINNRYLYLYLY